MKRVILFCITLIVLLTACLPHSVSKITNAKITYDEDNGILIMNQKKYHVCKDIHWRAIEVDEKIGRPSDWPETFNHLLGTYETGVYKIKGNDDYSVIHVQPEGEFDYLYLRSDLSLPSLDSDNFTEIEFIDEGFPTIDHKQCDNMIADKDLIRSIIEALTQTGEKFDFMNLEDKKKFDLLPIGTVLLYSDTIKGCAFHLGLYKNDKSFWLEYPWEKYSKVSKEAINKLKRTQGCYYGQKK